MTRLVSVLERYTEGRRTGLRGETANEISKPLLLSRCEGLRVSARFLVCVDSGAVHLDRYTGDSRFYPHSDLWD